VSQSTSRARRALFSAAAIGISISAGGCSSLGSPRSFFSFGAKEPAPVVTPIGGSPTGLTAQLKSMGSTMSSAVGKAKDAVASTFSVKPVETLGQETSLAHMPKNLGPEIWLTQGHVAEMKGNHNAALDLYTKALEREPNNVPALQSIARLYSKQEQFSSAIDFYQRVVGVQPIAAHFAELAEAQRAGGNITEAQASIQRAISMEPGTTKYHNIFAGILVSIGRSDEAVRQLEQVFPPAVANYNVAYLHFVNKNIAAAQQHLQIALQADPNLKPARDLLATLSQGQTAQTAVAAYNAAGNVFRTAQGIASPSVQASQIPFAPTSGQLPAVNAAHVTAQPGSHQGQYQSQTGSVSGPASPIQSPATGASMPSYGSGTLPPANTQPSSGSWGALPSVPQ
jgi:Tfp pilus assembly protein PilF